MTINIGNLNPWQVYQQQVQSQQPESGTSTSTGTTTSTSGSSTGVQNTSTTDLNNSFQAFLQAFALDLQSSGMQMSGTAASTRHDCQHRHDDQHRNDHQYRHHCQHRHDGWLGHDRQHRHGTAGRTPPSPSSRCIVAGQRKRHEQRDRANSAGRVADRGWPAVVGNRHGQPDRAGHIRLRGDRSCRGRAGRARNVTHGTDEGALPRPLASLQACSVIRRSSPPLPPPPPSAVSTARRSIPPSPPPESAVSIARRSDPPSPPPPLSARSTVSPCTAALCCTATTAPPVRAMAKAAGRRMLFMSRPPNLALDR